MAEVKNSKRVKVIVEKKYADNENKIFSSTVITKDGKQILERFRVPVGIEVELPVEIITQLKGRQIAKFVNSKMKMVNEFSIEKV